MSIRYIFSINPGRSGSEYLARLFGFAVNAVSLHEGTPLMNGLPMEQFNNGNETALRALMPLKMRQIQRHCANGKKIYCESTHSFIQGWGLLLPDAYIPQEEIAVIILRRDPEKTADSLLRVHDVPGASLWSRTWYLSPGLARNLSIPPESANSYDLCQWSIHEIDLRTQEYKKNFPHITYVECDISQLNDYDFVSSLFLELGLVPGKGLRDVVGRKTNKKNEWPVLPRPDLLQPSHYMNADLLSSEQRSELVLKMVDWLHSNHGKKIRGLRRDYAGAGTFAPAVIALVAQTESELEKIFRHALRFTETERILIYELLYSIDSGDVAFSHIHRIQENHLHYEYDYNIVVDIPHLFHELGWRSGLRTLWLLALRGKSENEF